MPEDFEEWYGPINKVDAVKKKVSHVIDVLSAPIWSTNGNVQ